MPDRAWLGWSRRWFAAQQTPADPVPVTVVGHDESDGAALNLARMASPAAVGFFSRVALFAGAFGALVSERRDEPDLFVTAALFESSATTLNLRVTPDVDAAYGVVTPVTVLRPGAPVRALEVQTLAAPLALTDALQWQRFNEWVYFDGGLLVPGGSMLEVWTPVTNASVEVHCAFRCAS